MVLWHWCSKLARLLSRDGRHVAEMGQSAGVASGVVGGCRFGCVGALWRDDSTYVRWNQGPPSICTQGYRIIF